MTRRRPGLLARLIARLRPTGLLPASRRAAPPRGVARRMRALSEGFAGRLPAADVAECLDLVAHNEPGAALETLCVQLEEHDVAPSRAELAEIRALAAAMGLPDADWSFLHA